MKSIGGYFELEIKKGVNIYHDTPHQMKSGRSALHLILEFIKPTIVHIPYYTCNALLEPFENAQVQYQFYEIDEKLEPKSEVDLKEGEYILYINYFGLKGEFVEKLSEKYKDKLIVELYTSFFYEG